MFEEFFLRALFAGIGVAAIAGPLGCFVVWRRMAYFGDAMAHSGLLGVALGIAIGIEPTVGVVAVVVLVALLLFLLQRNRRLSGDTLLGILSHSALSLGLIALSLMAWVRVDLMAYLFGDVLAVSWNDVALIYGGGLVAVLLLVWLWRPLLAVTVDEDLAAAEGVSVTAVRLGYMLLIAVVIAAAMKIVGVLLITSLLIAPAAAARRLAGTPESMALISAAIGCVAALGGLFGSLTFDTPSGPSIVATAAILFAMTLVPRGRKGAAG